MKTDFDTYFGNLERAGKVPTFYAVPVDVCTVGRTCQDVADAFLRTEYHKGFHYVYDPQKGEYYQECVKDRTQKNRVSFQDIQARLFAYIFFQQIFSYISISQSDLDTCWTLVDALIMSGEVENFSWDYKL